ncbi:hypothetical protein GCM10020001_107150 [Nonomuraea salmonea]
MQRAYLPVLRFATRFKLVTILIGVAVFVATMGLAGSLRTNFLDASGQNTLSLSQRMPVGTDLVTTDEAAAKVEEVLADQAGVETYQVNVGGGNAMTGGLGGGADRASFSVTLGEDVDAAVVERELREKIDGLSGVGEVTVGGAGGGGFATDTVEVIVRAADVEALRAATDQVKTAMEGVGGLQDLSSNLESSAPRVEVVVNREKAAERGLSEAAVGQAVAQAFRGAPLGQITLEGRASDLVLRGAEAPEDIEAVKDLRLPTAGGLVSLSSVASVRQVDGPTQVTRIDGERSATVSARAADAGNLGAVTQELTEKLDGLDLGAGGVVRDRWCVGGSGGRVRGSGDGDSGGDRDRVHDHGGDVPEFRAAGDLAGVDSVRGDGRDRAAGGDGHGAGRAGVDRGADAGRHRGDERDRADRPDQSVP